MRFILDTNIVSELRKARLGKANLNLMAWSENVDAADRFVSVITLMELALGVLSVERKDVAQAAMLRAWLNEHVLREFAERTLPIDTVVAQHCAHLHVPDRRGERDAFIAATALVYGIAVVTRNVDDFKAMGVSLVNPDDAYDLFRGPRCSMPIAGYSSQPSTRGKPLGISAIKPACVWRDFCRAITVVVLAKRSSTCEPSRKPFYAM